MFSQNGNRHTVSDHHRPIRDITDDVLSRIEEGAFERELNHTSPVDAFAMIQEARLGALRIPADLGGYGIGLVTFFEFLMRLATVDPNVAHALRAHYVFVDERLFEFRRGQERLWLDHIVAGDLFGNANTELTAKQAAGLEPSRFQARLSADGDEYRLNGTKFYSTGSLYRQWVVVSAVNDAGAVVRAIVPTNRDGVRIDDDWDGIGQRLTASGTAVFDNVRVYTHEVFIRQAGHVDGYGSPMAQLYLTAVTAGILEAINRDAVTVLRGRTRTFAHGVGSSAKDDPLLQHVVGQLASDAFAGRAVVLEAARALADAAETVMADGVGDKSLLEAAKMACAKAKVTIENLVSRSGWQLFDVAGASATLRTKNLDRHWRNARTIASHNPVLYKTRALGDYLVNGDPLPRGSAF